MIYNTIDKKRKMISVMAEILRMAEDGETNEAICRKFNVTRDCVYRFLRKHGEKNVHYGTSRKKSSYIDILKQNNIFNIKDEG
jgi:DNA invertase Pin-like site-specific DNA recombinase